MCTKERKGEWNAYAPEWKVMRSKQREMWIKLS